MDARQTPTAEIDRDDERHAAVVAAYPGGLTPQQFQDVTLRSADETDRVYQPSVADAFAWYSLVLGMLMKGLLRRHGGPNAPLGPLYITEAGRAALEATGG